MQNADKIDNLEQFTNPANDNADVINRDLNKGKYISAERAYLDNQEAFNDAELKEFDRLSDNQTRRISHKELPEGPLDDEQVESAMKVAGNEEINEVGGKYFTGHKEITRADELIIENNKLLDKMDNIMKNLKDEVWVSKWSKPISIFTLPLLTSIIGASSGLKLKKLLRKLNQNASELGVIGEKIKTMSLGKRLDPDKISPNMGHYLQIGGYTSLLGGGVVFAVNPGIGAGIVAGGALVTLAGKVKTAYDFFGARATQKSLKELKLAVSEAREENNKQNGIFEQHQSAYVKGARENIEKLAT